MSPEPVEPRYCRTKDVDTGNCSVCVEYRRLREENRKRWGHA